MFTLVIRRLSMGETLVHEGDEEGWVLDLTAFRHKTSKFWGPSVSSLSKPVSDAIDLWLTLEGRIEGEEVDFEFPNVDEEGERRVPVNRANKDYLFHQQSGVNYCYSSSQWCSKVKKIFGKYSPTGVEPSPKLLRASFIVALRDANFGSSEVLKSAAKCMRHSIDTQGHLA